MDTPVEQFDQEFSDRGTKASWPLCVCLRFDQHHPAHNRAGDRLADAYRGRAQRVLLHLRHKVERDLPPGLGTVASVHRIDDGAVCYLPLQYLPMLRHPICWIQRNLRPLVHDLLVAIPRQRLAS